MAVLSLSEAAEQVGASKVDIWRAIRSGLLLALKTADGDFVVDSADLLRVFEAQPREHRPTGQDATAPAEPRPETSAAPETRDDVAVAAATPERGATDDVAVAFAALGAELRELLASRAD